MATSITRQLYQALTTGVRRLDDDCVTDLKQYVLGRFDPATHLFVDRYGKGDYYYSTFGFALARALRLGLPLPARCDKSKLSFVHFRAACQLENLCWYHWCFAARQRREIETYYRERPDVMFPQGDKTSLYSQFLRFTMLEDAGGALPQIVAQTTETLTGMTALALLQWMKFRRVDPALIQKMQSLQQVDGGFLPYAGAARGDLLSGALAAFALVTTGSALPYPMTDWVDGHYQYGKSFVPVDGEISDVEYTFYGVLNAAF